MSTRVLFLVIRPIVLQVVSQGCRL
jgi:hypothetical protein